MVTSDQNTGSSRAHLSWYLSARVGGMSLILLGAVFYQFWEDRPHSTLLLNTLYLLIGLSYLQALGAAICLRNGIYVRYLAEFQIFWDLFLATILVGLTGGQESLFTFVYLLVIISASLFLSRRHTFIVTLLATLLYVGVVVLQHYLQGEGEPLGHIFLPALIHTVAFFLAAHLASSLAERWRASLVELEQKAVDYQELEEFNRTILANIGSGLMMVGLDKHIKTFNRAAMRITGLDFEQVYNKKVHHFFPEMELFVKGGMDVVRGETVMELGDGDERILGYATTQIQHMDRQPAGTLVTFQDLTEFKALEERVRRVDRLAAIGRMARGMAHEIRNPLASISGSVQLLLEREDISDQGRRLMNIVEREADRLSALLGDFLNYARPADPHIVKTDMQKILNDLTDLTQAEARLHDIELVADFEELPELLVDPSQIRQALWNLLVNARDAVSKGGRIRILGDSSGEIRIEDSGSGIAEKDLSHVFDPFFTTKDKGTGLGLATTHAIVEAHNGQIRVENTDEGGARFVIQLPVSSR